jgi:hypothetical protein
MLKFTKLTRNNMRKLLPNETINENGIIFERLVNSDGRFSVNIMVDGQRVHRIIGKESDGTTRTQAEELIAKLRTDARHGRLNLPKGRKLAFSFTELEIVNSILVISNQPFILYQGKIVERLLMPIYKNSCVETVGKEMEDVVPVAVILDTVARYLYEGFKLYSV